jgi:hypothetical protein
MLLLLLLLRRRRLRLRLRMLLLQRTPRKQLLRRLVDSVRRADAQTSQKKLIVCDEPPLLGNENVICE